MFNEEFRAILRRNLYSIDQEDSAQKLGKEILQYLQLKENFSVSSELLEGARI